MACAVSRRDSPASRDSGPSISWSPGSCSARARRRNRPWTAAAVAEDLAAHRQNAGMQVSASAAGTIRAPSRGAGTDVGSHRTRHQRAEAISGLAQAQQTARPGPGRGQRQHRPVRHRAPRRGRDAEYQRDRGLSITVYVGGRKGSASTASLAPEAIAETVAALDRAFRRRTGSPDCGRRAMA